MENPINQSDVKTNVPSCLFALNPFVTKYFLFLSAEGLVKPRFEKAVRLTLISEYHIDER